MKKVYGLLSFVLIISMFGCSGSSNAVSEELRKELDGYKNEIAAQNKEIATLKKSLDAGSTKPLETEMTAMKNEINTLKTDIRRTNSAVNSLKTSVEDMQGAAPLIDTTHRQLLDDVQLLKAQLKELDGKLSEGRGQVIPSPGVPSASPATAKASAPASSGKKVSAAEYRNEYVNSLGKFQNGQYAEARSGFQNLVSSDARNELADNAQYWIGECFYMEKKYEEAILAFEKVFSFSDRGKYDDAQFKLGLAYRKLGNDAKARDEFERLVNYYEDSEWKSQAQNILNKLK